MQNIGADNAGDAFYRYKMPKLVAKIEGRGNGIKTNVVNNVDIARALDRPPTYTLKHFGCELGAQTNFNPSTGVSIVNGAHDAKKLSEVLEIFIKKYVQCYACGNPETIVKVRKEAIFLKCKACGHTSDVDMRDKLTTFIVKNPPVNKLSKSEAKVKKDEKERMKAAEKEAKRAEKVEAKEKKKKEKNKASMSEKSKDEDGAAASNSDNADGEDNAEEDEEDATVFKTDLSADAVARRQREQLSSAAAALVQGEEATSALPNMQSETSSTIIVPDPVPEEDQVVEEEDDLEPVDLIRQFIEGNKPARELVDLLSEVEVPGGLVGKMKIFYSALLGGQTCSVSERMAAPRDKYILALKRDGKHQASSLIALEHYLTQVEPARMAEMPFVLKMLFEEDLIEDEIIVGWGSASSISLKNGVDEGSAEKIRGLCEKVLAWLEESDDETDDE